MNDPAGKLLAELHRLGVRLSVEGDQLRMNAPRGVVTPELREQLQVHKQALLTRLRAAGPDALPLRRYPREGVLPLSYGQERLWFLDQLGVGAVYNIPWGTVLTGRIDVPAVERALNEIVRRHENLRATFRVVDGRPAAIIAPQLHIPLRVVDIQHLPTAEARDAEVLRLAGVEEATPFDLAHGPLLRPLLIRVEPEAYALSLTIHHIVSDFWSIGVLMREFGALYDAFRNGGNSPLPDLPVQYADFACWQRERLAQGALDAQLAYWRERLAGAPAASDLPTDRPRPPQQSYRGAAETIFLSAELTAQLKAVGRQAGATPFMALLAAFKTLLLRYTGQTDIVIGTPIAGRNEQQLESLIGIFLNTLALRTDLSGDPPFLELLGRVRDTALGAYAHQDLPFERILEELRPERDPSRTPLFQVLFNLFNIAGQPVQVSGVGGRSFTVSEGTAKFDLTLYGLERPGGLALSAVYNVDLFNAGTIVRLMNHFRVLLESVAADPTTRLSRLPLLTPEERQALAAPPAGVLPRNDFVEFPRPHVAQSLPARFAAVVAAAPDRPAVQTRRANWSYAELDARARAVAAGLAARRPAGPQRLALLLEHDAPLLAAVLGALRAGLTYVPLDPTYPRGRLVETLADAQAWGILASQRHRELAAQLADGQLAVLELEPLLERSSSPAALPAVGPDDLAYILYTSGSTGRPKGVLQSHRNVLHYARATANGLRLRADDRVTLLASLGFDAAVVDIYSTLLTGATLLPLDIRTEGLDGLADWLDASGATVYHSTPTIFRHFVRTLALDRTFPDVRLLVLGGEASQAEDVRRFRRHFTPPALFVNLMGASEASTASLWFADHETPLERETLPLGHPVADTELLLLDEQGAPTELLGELAICSPHVALGYWNRPDLATAAFAVDAAVPARRRYRTGDWARRLADGQLVFAGRRDQQVKVRGVRVELGEIELALSAHPALAEAAVRYVPESERIIAWVVSRAGAAVTAADLREALRERLPDFMLPSAFVFLDALPLTTSGKINRRALPLPAATAAEPAGYVAPRTPTEKLLAELWAAALQVERVGIYDNFFDLGGHSLLLIRVIAQFEQRTGVRINPVEFIRQTLGQIAATHAAGLPAAPPVAPAPRPAAGLEPCYFGPPGSPLFGCYTFAAAESARGVVICPPVLHEYLRCHRPLRLLAHRLAAAGIHALRFDYYGCGDSAGAAGEVRFARWHEDVGAALDALKSRVGLDRVALLGWRLGANLALAAASGRDDVDALVLWDPIVDGAALLDELRAAGTSLAVGNGHAGTTVLDVCAAPVTAALARDLHAVRLPPRAQLGAVRTLLLETGEAPPGPAALPGNVQHQVVADSRVWLQEPFEAIVPQQSLQTLVAWLAGGAA